MFGMGFTEILIIAVIAILFLGPDKLPSTMVEIAKFFRSVKNTVGSVKDTLEQEMHVSDIKQEALAYKTHLEQAASAVDKLNDVKGAVGAELASITDSALDASPEVTVKKAETTSQEVTFKKKKKKEENVNKEEPTDV